MNRVLTIVLLAFASLANAAEAPKDSSRQTFWGLYSDSKEAYALKTSAEGAKVLFVDVRD